MGKVSKEVKAMGLLLLVGGLIPLLLVSYIDFTPVVDTILFPGVFVVGLAILLYFGVIKNNKKQD